MDPSTVEDAHPARFERVRWSWRNHLPRKRAGPGAVRDVPGRVDLLVLDGIYAHGRLEPDLPDRNRVAPREAEVAVDAQREVAAVDRDIRRVLVVQRRDRDLRVDDAGRNVERPLRVPGDEHLPHLPPELGRAHLPAGMSSYHRQMIERRNELGVDRLRVDPPLQVVDDRADRGARVLDVRPELRVDLAARQLPPRAREEQAVAASLESL